MARRTNNLFGEDEPPVARSTRTQPPGGASSIFSDPEPVRPASNRQPPGGASKSLFGGDDEPVRTSTRVNNPGGTGGSSLSNPILDGPVESIKKKPSPQQVSSITLEETPREAPKISTRVNVPGGTGGQSNIFGNEEARPSTRVNAPGGTGGQSSVGLAITGAGSDNTQRPSTRVNAPGGTGGQSSVGIAPEVKKQSAAAAYNNASHFSLSDDSSNKEPPSSKRHSSHVNQESHISSGLATEGSDTRAAVRSSGKALEQSFNLANDPVAPVKPSLKVTHQPGGESHFNRLGSDDNISYEKFDGLGEDAKVKRETKRVTQPPGGSSSIIF